MPLFNLNPKESAKIVFGRESELDELAHLIKARRWAAVLGPRMVGKTCLIKAVYVNLWEQEELKVCWTLWHMV